MYKKLNTKIAKIITKFFSWYAHTFHKKEEVEYYDPVYWYNYKPIIKEAIKPISVCLCITKKEYGYPTGLYGLEWKDKLRSPRFEQEPYFAFNFLKWQIKFIWTTDKDSHKNIDYIYWETILDIAAYNKSVMDAVKSNTWQILNIENYKWIDENLKTLGYLNKLF